MFTSEALGRYGDFGQMDEGQGNEGESPMMKSYAGRGRGGGGHQGGGYGGQQMMGGGGGGMMGGAAMGMMRQEIIQIKQVIMELQDDRDKLRNGIRKLKVENSRIKHRMKRMNELLKKATGDEVNLDDDDMDEAFDSIRDFYLIGGPLDPLGLRFDARIVDAQGKEHKSAERYFWYKMAETFNDTQSAENIRNAPTVMAAEEKMKMISGFDESIWNPIKLRYWEEAQRLKFEQNRDLQNILISTAPTYLAVASQDKVFGTGWRKNRDESSKPRMWDGENGGGKVLMRLRDQFKAAHQWQAGEEEETATNVAELKKSVWRKEGGREGGFGGGSGGGGRYQGGGGYGGRSQGGGDGFGGGGYTRRGRGSYTVGGNKFKIM